LTLPAKTGGDNIRKNMLLLIYEAKQILKQRNGNEHVCYDEHDAHAPFALRRIV
jgi:hypothetical protein